MKKYYILLVMFSFFLCSCKTKTGEKDVINSQKVKIDSVTIVSNKENIKITSKKTLENTYDFKKLFKTTKEIKHTANKYADIRTNNTFLLDNLFGLNEVNFSVKTTSYEYKKDLVFYVHTIKHTNDTISVQPFLENAQGKETEGYLGSRILVFAMKNDRVANFIDIPEKRNPLKLREELLEILYKKIDSDVILCFYTRKCVYKDLRK